MPFPWSTAQSNAVARLALVNGGAYDPTTNPNGLRNGGHIVNFANDLVDTATAAGAISDAATFAGAQATAAGQSATDAAAYAAKMSGTSATTLAFGPGPKTLTTQAGKFFEAGRALRLVSSAGYMVGKSTGYSGTTLSFTAALSVGSGSASDWTIYVEGETGSAGTIAIAGVTRLAPDQAPTVTNTGTAAAAQLAFGVPGGMPAGLFFKWSTNTAATDPTTGRVKVGSASLTTATALYISETDAAAVAQSAVIASWDDSTNPVRGQLRIEDIAAPANFVVYNVTGDLVDNGPWNTLPIAYVDKGGTLADGASVRLEYRATGNKGTDGQNGNAGAAATVAVGTVNTGAAGSQALVTNAGSTAAAVLNFTLPRGDQGLVGPVVALRYTFDIATADADPGNGTVRFNNATVSAVTALYVDDVEVLAGVNVSALLDTFGTSTTVNNKGLLVLKDVNDPSKQAYFRVTGAVVNGTGYRKVPVVYVAGNGGFTAGGALGVLFARTGDKGSDGGGAGNVVGPTTSTVGAFALFDNATGTLLASGGTPGALATKNAVNNNDWSGAALGVGNGGTGATNVAAARTNLGVAIGTDVQAQNANLQALAGVTGSANLAVYFTAAATLGTYTISALGRSLAGSADAAAAQATLQVRPGIEVQAYNANLAAYAGLTGAADRVAYFTGAGALALATFTTTGRSIVAAADAAAARSAIGAVIGTNVQAWDADLDAIAALTTTAYGRSLLTGADAAGTRTTLGLAAVAASGSATDLTTGTLDVARLAARSGGDVTAPAGSGVYTIAAGAVTFAKLAAAAIASAASDIWSNVANKLATVTALWAAQAPVALTYAATVTPDMGTFLNATLTLTGNCTLANPTNPKAGQSGFIRVSQDATGSRTLSYGSGWKFAGGTPTASTAASSVDVIAYVVEDATTPIIRAVLNKGFA